MSLTIPKSTGNTERGSGNRPQSDSLDLGLGNQPLSASNSTTGLGNQPRVDSNVASGQETVQVQPQKLILLLRQARETVLD